MKILFISRAYPPILGGIENQNAALAKWLPKHAEVTTIANKRGKKFLPLFLPYATIASLLLAPRHDVVLLGDGVLGIVGWAIKLIYRKKPVVSIVHGLDIRYASQFYQALWVKRFLPSLDRLIAVGNETIRAGVRHGIPESKFVFIPNGVDTEIFSPKNIPRSRLGELLGIDIEGKQVICTGGRLVKRKGVAWFIRHVLPNLPENVLYAVSGDGPDRKNIEAAIVESDMNHRAFLLGRVSDDDRDTLLNTCALFVQPNIPVEGDMEGFGLVVLEAASVGIPIVVSRLEGLRDAVAEGENGRFAEPENAESFRSVILEILSMPDARAALGAPARAYTKEHFQWSSVAKRYLDVLTSMNTPH